MNNLRRYGPWGALALIVLVSRLDLLRTFDVELSQDGFEAVRTLNLLQAQGTQAVPPDLRDRFLLHPLYMLLLAACRLLTPAAVDFYFTARLLSAVLTVVAVILLYEFSRNAFPSPWSTVFPSPWKGEGRVRVASSSGNLAPHRDPLPGGAREERVASSSGNLAPHPDPLPGWAREERVASSTGNLAPHRDPLPGVAREEQVASSSGNLAPHPDPLSGGAREERVASSSGDLAPHPDPLPGGAREAGGEIAAWLAALFLAFAPTVLWESITILSSTLFLALYLAVLLALLQSRYRLAALVAFLASLTRYEGVVLFALVLLALAHREWQGRTTGTASPASSHASRRGDWLAALAPVLAFPLALLATGWIASGNPLEFLGAQSMASIWLRFLAPGDFARRSAFFVTQYPQLLPSPLVALGVIGALVALVRYRGRATALLLAAAALYLVFFETLVWFNYTTLEVRFLMYPGFPLLVFAALALGAATEFVPVANRAGAAGAVVIVVAVALALLGASYRQGIAGMQFQYRMMASQREVADELAQIVPAARTTNLLSYTGNSGALDLYARQRGLQFTFTDFRYAPDDNAEQFVVDRDIHYVVYPAGNAFARAKYPYLARFETQTHGAVTFQPLTQFATTLDNQLYSIWSVTW